jgi:selenocysteine-specific elongation factor
MPTNLILGTSGHIDHGKSSLIRILTGTDPDRLPEEKKRGITIELGYAALDLGEFHLGIVDVPGHEKFVRQMLAGATGMDLAMLVVAADDSIKQQTREHLDILRLLNLREGVIVLTKTDLVEAEWLDLVEAEIRELVQGTFLEMASIVRVSSKTGAGFDDLKKAILDAARRVVDDLPDSSTAPFRMAIDRSFAIEGFGAVVTGSVSSGVLRVGDVIELQPAQIEVRVRGLQNHDTKSDVVSRGQRAAINLTGLRHGEIPRGNELATLGHLKPTNQLAVELLALPGLDKPVKDRSRVRFHLGTSEVSGVLRLPHEKKQFEPGERGFAVLFLSESVVATWGQPFVVRLESPVTTLGGGRIAFPNRLSTNRPTAADWNAIAEAVSPDPKSRASAAAYLAGLSNWKPSDLIRWTAIHQIDEIIETMISEKTIVRIPLSKERSWLVHSARLEEISATIEQHLMRLHQEHPLRLGHSVSEVQHCLDYLPEPELFRVSLERLIAAKKVHRVGAAICLDGLGPKLSKGETQLYGELVEKIRVAGLAVEPPKILAAGVAKNRDSVPQLLKLGVDSGQLLQITPDWIVHRDVYDNVLERLKTEFERAKTLTVSDIRSLLDVSRKFAVPLCEYLDKIGFTTRDGDQRRLA